MATTNHAAAHGDHNEFGDHISSPSVYITVYFVLLALLAVSLWLHHVELGTWALTVGVLIGAAKAVVIGIYFMHLKYAERLNIWAACAGVVWLSLLFLLALVDYLSRPVIAVSGN